MKTFSKEVILESGRKVTVYHMVNNQGMEVEVLSIGATLTKIAVPDSEGKIENILLEWADLDAYEKNPGCLGGVMGRVAGRIHKGQVTIKDQVYQLPINNNGNTLHGGLVGFHLRDWEGRFEESQDTVTLVMAYKSESGEEGFPGKVEVSVSYTLDQKNGLTLEYKAITNEETVVNLTNHAYFNLSGNVQRDILDHEVYIDSEAFYELDGELIPTGKLIALEEEPYFDFRQPKKIGQDIDKDNKHLRNGAGYDHVWHLRQGENAITLYEYISKRLMTVTTSEPCVVMYSMNHADDQVQLAHGETQKTRLGVCFETQRPAIGYNEVNKEGVILKPGQVYHQCTRFEFSIR